MVTLADGFEALSVVRVFPAWSILVPLSFDETYVHEHNYWHAYDEQRSISLTSMLLTERGRPVPAPDFLAQLGGQLEALGGTAIDEMPRGLAGRAVIAKAPQPARASTILSGVLATDGRVLLATITADDTDWSRMIWRSIQHHSAPRPPRADRRAPAGAWRRPH